LELEIRRLEFSFLSVSARHLKPNANVVVEAEKNNFVARLRAREILVVANSGDPLLGPTGQDFC
jgi:hypothetical protein